MKESRYTVTLAISMFVILADQFSKALVRRHLLIGETAPVIQGLFNLAHVRNTGAVWGVLQDQNALLIFLSLLVLILVAVFYRRLACGNLGCSIAMGFMLGGIVGNLVDRVKHGWVADFLDFHWSGRHWPCFNIADAAICAGVALYVIFSLRSSAGRMGENGRKHDLNDAKPVTRETTCP